ncbi:VOC family protein [Pantoea ananatis]|uniref:VOC family protein n=1 Tax=Pantoea ananas TaxID=553 RepID=UPI00158C482F|nr:VOC family protein [Pantoea ananatis]MBA4823458.1 VOC family protein [Pantoea ananatis]QKV88036.1 VOC family protein [Pantoea ananatis]
MIEITDFGHINIIVQDVDEATNFYKEIFGFELVQSFKGFKNDGFAKSAGYLNEEVNVDISFLKIPNTKIYIEIMRYIYPSLNNEITDYPPNYLGGPRHIALRTRKINEAFDFIKKTKGVSLINDSNEYKPTKLSKVRHDEFIFAKEEINNNIDLKIKASEISSSISFFYFTDKYGVTWEIEEEPDDVEDPAFAI